MKKLLLTLTASAILLCGTADAKEKPGFASDKIEKTEKQSRQKQAVQHLPQNAERHGWDGANWNHQEDVEFTYTSNNINERIYYPAGTTTPMMKEVTLYDAAGHETGYESYYYMNNAWHLSGGWREIHTHGANNRIDESVQEYYNSTAQAWDKDEKTLYDYDTNGNLLSETYQSWFSGGWINENREIYTYNGNVIVEIVEETFVGTGWEPEYRFIDVVWHNQQEFEPVSYTGQEMENGTWVNEERSMATYGANGSYVENTESWDGTQWVTDGRYTETYDSHGNETEWKYENYNNGTWEVEDGGERIHTYSGDTLVESVNKYWVDSIQTIVNAEKWVYSNFINVTTSVTAGPANANGVKFYPNPAENVLNITLEGPGYNTAIIADLSGRVVSSTDIRNTQQTQLDVSGLESGIYILKLSGDTSSVTERIVIK